MNQIVKSKLYIIVEGIITIKNEYIYIIADDCIFYYASMFIENSVIEREITYNDGNRDSKIFYSVIRGFLVKKVYVNDNIMLYKIEDNVILDIKDKNYDKKQKNQINFDDIRISNKNDEYMRNNAARKCNIDMKKLNSSEKLHKSKIKFFLFNAYKLKNNKKNLISAIEIPLLIINATKILKVRHGIVI